MNFIWRRLWHLNRDTFEFQNKMDRLVEIKDEIEEKPEIDYDLPFKKEEDEAKKEELAR